MNVLESISPEGAAVSPDREGSTLEIRGLRVEFNMPHSVVRAVNDVSLTVRQGETIGVVGESGSGKSVTFLSVMGMVRKPGRIAAGSVFLDGKDLSRLDQEELRRIRGNEISMVFQDPQTSLNPVFPVGRQLIDVIRAHTTLSHAAARARALEALDLVQIPEARRRFHSYPHEFSGGMRQRVMIAMALALRPRFIIADEPTTALDVTMQAQVLELLHGLRSEVNVGLVLITHDLGVVARSADRVIVMYGGRVVEEGDVRQIFHNPRHPYSMALLRSMPRIDAPREARLPSIGGTPPNLAHIPQGCAFGPRCFLRDDRPRCSTELPQLRQIDPDGGRTACHFAEELKSPDLTPLQSSPLPTASGSRDRPDDGDSIILEVANLRTHFPAAGGFPFRRKAIKAVDGVSLEIRAGQTVGLVGESGCGKSTLGRTLVRLNRPTSGSIVFLGRDVSRLSNSEMRPSRSHLQMVFQDPYASLDPRMTVMEILTEPLATHGMLDGNHKARVLELMERVGLNAEHADRRPHEFSGGQRQRIGIARAIILKPKLIILDEPVSALDVSVQAQIINLLKDLQEEFDLTYLFIAHDLSVVRHVCDRVLVMYLGRIVEAGDRDVVFDTPSHPYTQALLSAVPLPDPDVEATRKRIILRGSVPSPISPPTGCRFHPRCQRAAAMAGRLANDALVTLSNGIQVPRQCADAYPQHGSETDSRYVACHFPYSHEAGDEDARPS